MQVSLGPIGTIDPNQPIVIHGAGIAGLLMGYYLKKEGFQVSIKEKNPYVGGKIQTHLTDYGPVETAANAIFTNQDVIELLDELNLKYIQATPKLKKKIWRFGKIKSFPFKSYELMRILLCLFRKVPTVNIEKLSVFDFFLPLCGPSFTEDVISAGLGGIYGVGARDLNFLSVFKYGPKPGQNFFQYFRMLKKLRNRSHKPTSVSFEEGMQTFISALAKELEQVITLETSQEFNTQNNQVLCCDSRSAADILKNSHPDLAALLGRIEYTTLKTSTFFLKAPIPFLKDSFGVVFAPGTKYNFAGILNNTDIFKRSAGKEQSYSYTLISRGEEDIDQLERNFLSAASQEEPIKLLAKHTHWDRAIPVYNFNLYDSVLKLRTSIIKYNGLVLFGNYTGGISIREMVTSAKEFAKLLRAQNSNIIK